MEVKNDCFLAVLVRYVGLIAIRAQKEYQLYSIMLPPLQVLMQNRIQQYNFLHNFICIAQSYLQKSGCRLRSLKSKPENDSGNPNSEVTKDETSRGTCPLLSDTR